MIAKHRSGNQASADGLGLAGVERLNLEFLDDKLTLINLAYSSDTKWQSVGQFIDSLTKSLSLPNAWEGEKYGDSQTLSCAGFKLTARVQGGHAELELEDMVTKSITEKRKRELEENKRKTFKP